LRLLANREHSKNELTQKMLLKGHQRATVESVVDELATEGWQNDARYAESFIRSRLLKGQGPARIIYDLRQQGIRINDDSVLDRLDQAAQELFGGWLALLTQVYRKKFGFDDRLSGTEWVKRKQFLLQRGFTGAMLAELIKHLNIKLS